MFAQPAEFLLGVASREQLAEPDLPEIAFAGRSNVGKSSLINALTGRRMLARTSKTPGRTQQLNFFRLGDSVVLVDLPGYGFAAAPRAKVEMWNRLVRDYLKGRPTLARVLVLVDARHGLKPNDREIVTLLAEAAVAHQFVLTKSDLVGEKERAARRLELEAFAHRQQGAHPEVHVTSARTRLGIDELRAALAQFVDEAAGLRSGR